MYGIGHIILNAQVKFEKYPYGQIIFVQQLFFYKFAFFPSLFFGCDEKVVMIHHLPMNVLPNEFFCLKLHSSSIT